MEDDCLRIDAPVGVLGPALKSQLRRQKSAIIEALKSTTYPCNKCGRFAFHVETTCYWCRREPPMSDGDQKR